VADSNSIQRESSLKYEMGYTPKEFTKTLLGLFISQTSYSSEELAPHHWKIAVDGESTVVAIQIKEAPPRVIALLTLPVLNVSFKFHSATEIQQQVFMKAFFRYFHKGGG
jgi:hypothetical protein